MAPPQRFLHFIKCFYFIMIYIGRIVINLTLGAQIKKTKTKAWTTIKALNKLLCEKSVLPLDSKLLIHRAIVRSIITYGCPIWHTTAVTNLEVLRRLDRYVLRKIAAPPRELHITNEEIHVGLDIETLQEYINRLSVRFWTKRRLNDNSLIRNIGIDAKKKPYKNKNIKRCVM